jgi:two-component system phosphate regulon sensor histidine kinase PhoR
MRLPPARTEYLLVSALLLTGLLAGWIAGRPGAGLGTGATLGVLLLGWRLRRLARWALVPGLRPDPAPVRGLTGLIAERIARDSREMGARAERAEQASARWQEALSAIDEAIVILDAEQGIDWFNPAAKRLLGLRQPEDIGRRIANLLRFPGLCEFIATPDADGSFEVTVAGPSALCLQFAARAFGSGETLVLARDVSELRRLETVRQDFVANISHELRTPLTVIAGYVDTLEDLLPGDAPVVGKVLAQMRQQSARMESLLKDLLLLSQLESGEDGIDEESIAVCAMLEAIRENALAACAGGRRIALHCDAGLRYRARRVELESIFSNLVFNAVKYTGEGGSIDASFGLGDGAVLFSVRDDGIGIDPAHIPRLTERFYRVDKGRSAERGGTGLGLAIVKHALKRLGGELEVSSRPGEGSTFLCRLPAERLEVLKQVPQSAGMMD